MFRITAEFASPTWTIQQTIQNVIVSVNPATDLTSPPYVATATALTSVDPSGNSKSTTSIASTGQVSITTGQSTSFSSTAYSTIQSEGTAAPSAGLNSSKVAGIAIGCVVGGIVLTLLVVLFIVRHRFKSLLRTKFGKSEFAPVGNDKATVFPEMKESRDPTRMETTGRELDVGDVDSVNYAFMPMSR